MKGWPSGEEEKEKAKPLVSSSKVYRFYSGLGYYAHVKF